MQGTTRIDELKQKFHENPRRYFAPLANEYRKAGDPEQAIAICRAHLAQQPGHMSGHVVYGQALYDAKRIEEARTVFEKAFSLDPENVIVLRHLGDIARQSGKTDEARHWYGKALDVDPQDTEIAAYVAELTEPLMASAESRERVRVPAEPVDEQATGAEPTQPEPIEAQPAASQQAEVATQPDREEEQPPQQAEREIPIEVGASADYSPELELISAEAPAETPTMRHTPQSPFVTRTMAELYAQQGHRAAAIEIYRQLLESDPENQELTARIAELSARQTPTSGTPAVSQHFSEAELGEGDAWDTDSWAAGFSGEDSGVAEAFAEPDVEAPPARREPESAAETPPAAEVSRAGEQSPADAVGEATADEDYLAAIPTEESFEREQYLESAAAAAVPESTPTPVAEAEIGPAPVVQAAAPDTSTAHDKVVPEHPPAEPVPESDIVAYSPPVPEPAIEAVGATPVAELASEPPPRAAAPTTGSHPRTRTVREFFATLGARRPPEIPDRTEPELAEDDTDSDRAVTASPVREPSAQEPVYPLADDAFANLFAGSPVKPEDSRAAAALSAAVAHPPRKTPSPTVPRPAVTTAPVDVQESEEDIRRFREWLDGLTES